MQAVVFSMSRYDVIIRLPDNVPTIEKQAVLFELHGPSQNTRIVEGLLHWTGTTSGGKLAGIFAAELIPRTFFEMTIDDRRGEIRFPLDLTAFVRGEGYSEEARIVDYSLNGMGLEVSKPMQLDRRYEATLTVDGQMLKLPMLCCHNDVTEDGGYLTGVGLRCLEGALFSCNAFKPSTGAQSKFLSVSPRFPSLNYISGRGETPEVATPGAGPYDLLVSWFNKNAQAAKTPKQKARPVLSRTTILIASAMLFGMSLRSVGTMQAITMSFGFFGVVAYFGLYCAAKSARKFRNEEATRLRREIAERRLMSSGQKPI